MYDPSRFLMLLHVTGRQSCTSQWHIDHTLTSHSLRFYTILIWTIPTTFYKLEVLVSDVVLKFSKEIPCLSKWFSNFTFPTPYIYSFYIGSSQLSRGIFLDSVAHPLHMLELLVSDIVVIFFRRVSLYLHMISAFN